jgi:hypothetical protein
MVVHSCLTSKLQGLIRRAVVPALLVQACGGAPDPATSGLAAAEGVHVTFQFPEVPKTADASRYVSYNFSPKVLDRAFESVAESDVDVGPMPTKSCNVNVELRRRSDRVLVGVHRLSLDVAAGGASATVSFKPTDASDPTNDPLASAPK